ncbi:unnamed protein product [Protopolystoma xenopodis]|uniref:Integrase zinc-binding domain-containing protein n=1 Tax=Protopolystoma xenopodis TaxID=117903 RepID=A0A3S5ABP3_9PLAT|nr:unnamed protein product [Protopolystoma xenopodis]
MASVVSDARIDYQGMEKTQERECGQITACQWPKLTITHVDMPKGAKIWCDLSTGKNCPFVPSAIRKLLLKAVHNLAHPGLRPSRKLPVSLFFWPAMQTDIGKWTKACPVS